MRRVEIDDQIVVVTEREYLVMLQAVTGALETYMASMSQLHAQGFPDIKNWWKSRILSVTRQGQHLLSHNYDEELMTRFDLLFRSLKPALSTDERLIEIIARYFNLPLSVTDYSIRRLVRMLDSLGNQGPIWAGPEFWNEAQQSAKAFSNFEKAKELVDERLGQLLALTTEIS